MLPESLLRDPDFQERLQRWSQDPQLPPEDLCVDHPDLLGPLREAIGLLGKFDRGPAMGPTVSDKVPSDSSIPQHAGRYRLGRVIGQGGMGAVLEADDPGIGRKLAVKVPWLSPLSDSTHVRRRFLREARVTGRLQHPGVVPVHELGELTDGRPFFAMKLVEGQTLADLLGQRPNPSHDLPRFLNSTAQ